MKLSLKVIRVRMGDFSHRIPRRVVRPAALLSALSLTGCYMVPIDLRTGQPYAITPTQDPQGNIQYTAVPAPVSLTARLYPVNQQASQSGMLTATVTANSNNGRGTFSVNYLGEPLTGEATRVDDKHPTFGRIHAEVLNTPQQFNFTGRRGVANAFGPRGTSAQCEYLLTAPNRGTGACVFSDGAKYQIHFGT